MKKRTYRQQKIYGKAVPQKEKETKEFMDSLPSTLEEYHNKYKGETGSALLMIKNHQTKYEDNQMDYKNKKGRNPFIYNFNKYGYVDPVERKVKY